MIGFVTNAGFLDTNTADGLRQCLAEEFSSIYVFHLRGNQRTSGELSRKEGGKIFGSGSRAPIAISLLVKNPEATTHGQIHFHDIGDYLSREEKLEKLTTYGSIAGVADADAWQSITPDAHGDWVNQRDESFDEFIVLGDKKGNAAKLFDNFSQGVLTSRDAWCYNQAKSSLADHMNQLIAFYNDEVTRFDQSHDGLDTKARAAQAGGFIDTNATKMSWSRALKQELAKGHQFVFDNACLVSSLYRPFTKQWLYFNRRFNEMVYQMPRLFPDAAAKNRMICINGSGGNKGFTALMVDSPIDFNAIEAGAQCFPLYLYDDDEEDNGKAKQTGLFNAKDSTFGSGHARRDALTDDGLAHFQAAYPSETIIKEDVFYYVYGLLHSPDYRARYADNLSKELPRIPCVKTAADFRAFSKAGRDLAELHLNYETVKPYPLTIETGGKRLTDADYRVEKMRYGKTGKQKDLTTLHYNDHITLTGIPLEAYEYVVNGKPALDWVVERQRVKTDKASGIVNDANDWAIDTMHNPRYPLELVQRVITVSLETMKIVHALPALNI